MGNKQSSSITQCGLVQLPVKSNMKLTIMLYGDKNVGKTSLYQSLSREEISDIRAKRKIVDFKSVQTPDKYIFQIIILDSNQDFVLRSLIQSFPELVIALIFDLTNATSVHNVPNLISKLEAFFAPKQQLILIGTKADKECRVYPDLTPYANYRYFETSVMTKQGLNDLNSFLLETVNKN